MRNQLFVSVAAVVAMTILSACGAKVPTANVADSADMPQIWPDYTECVIPPNIAPLNFEVCDAGEEFVTEVVGEGSGRLVTSGRVAQWDVDDWHKLLAANPGKKLMWSVYAGDGSGKWTRRRFTTTVAPDSIDGYISYRLIDPGYVQYAGLTINQRNLSNFDEQVIYNNAFPCDERRGYCINCHVPRNQNRDGMTQFHVRQFNGGTVIINGKKAYKVNLKTDSTLSAGVYPAWHPTLPLITYSVNSTHQRFFTSNNQKIEVLDSKSGLIMYDLDRGTVSTILDEPEVMETFPGWSPAGDLLYYSAARYPEGVTPDNVDDHYDSLRYDILALRFDPATRSFSAPDTVVHASARSKSALLPRISPDGRWLLYCEAPFGTFHIWHKDSDLFIKDLTTGAVHPLTAANSPDTESYHSWSSNSRWIVFSSRRDDGSYTRPYIAYIAPDGNASKAFIVPQKEPTFYRQLMKSYNVPEFLARPVEVSRQELLKAVTGEARQAPYESKSRFNNIR